jgi:hypothetical protein
VTQELDEEVEKLVEIQNRIYAWRQKGYDNPVVQPGYNRLGKALWHLAQAIDIIKEPMG